MDANKILSADLIDLVLRAGTRAMALMSSAQGTTQGSAIHCS